MMIIFLGLLILTVNSSKCKRVINNDAVYIFDGLQMEEHDVELNGMTISNLETSTLYFRFCLPVQKCEKTISDSFAIIINNEGEKDQECVNLVKTEDYFANSFEQITSEAPDLGVVGNFYNPDNKYKIQFVLFCSQTELEIIDIIYNQDEQQYVIEMNDRHGCPLVRIRTILDFLYENNKVLAAILITIGLTECLMGKKILKPTLFIIGYLLGFFFALFILSELDTGYNPFFLWIGMMVAVLFGAVIGGASFYLDRAGIIAVGIGMGVVLSLLLWNAILAQFLQSDLILYTLMILLSLGCSYASFKLFDHVIIFCTSLIGSYLVFKAVGLVAGGFPSEIGNLSSRDPRYYIYFICILALAGYGVYHQYQQWGKKIITYDEFVELLNRDSKKENESELLEIKQVQGFGDN